MTLTEFLTARLDEDEALAREVQEKTKQPDEEWRLPNYYEDASGSTATIYWDVDYQQGGYTISAARVLAEVEAKRRIVDFAYNYAETIDGEWGCCHGADEIRRGECPDSQKQADEVLRLLALPYADHPDYDEGWRP